VVIHRGACSASPRRAICRPTRVLRGPLVRRRRAPRDPRPRRPGGAGRHRPAVRGTTSPASWCTPRSARTCGCPCRRRPPPRSPVRPCC
jgi:hypothetical protein